MTKAPKKNEVIIDDIGTTPVVNKPQRPRRAFGSITSRSIYNTPRWHYNPRSPKQAS